MQKGESNVMVVKREFELSQLRCDNGREGEHVIRFVYKSHPSPIKLAFLSMYAMPSFLLGGRGRMLLVHVFLAMIHNMAHMAYDVTLQLRPVPRLDLERLACQARADGQEHTPSPCISPQLDHDEVAFAWLLNDTCKGFPLVPVQSLLMKYDGQKGPAHDSLT
jgi:hypothetical protein